MPHVRRKLNPRYFLCIGRREAAMHVVPCCVGMISFTIIGGTSRSMLSDVASQHTQHLSIVDTANSFDKQVKVDMGSRSLNKGAMNG